MAMSENQRKKWPTWFKTIVGITFAGIALSVALMLFSRGMVDVVEDQLVLLREHRLSQAYYEYTSKQFQETTTLEAFRTFISLYPVLSHNEKFVYDSSWQEQSRGIVSGDLVSKDLHEMKAEYQLVKENGQWKIQGLRVKEYVTGDEAESATQPLVDLVSAQLKAMRKQDPTEAYYGFVSQDFQRETPFEAFRDFMHSNAIITSYTGMKVKDRKIEDDKGVVDLVLDSDKGEYILHYKLKREGGDWKILSLWITLPPEEAAKKDASDADALVPAVRNTLTLLQLDDIDAAYDSTAHEFQEATPFSTFKRFVDDHPVLVHSDLTDIKPGVIEYGVGTVRANLHDNEGMTTVQFVLGFDVDRWKIWELNIVDQPKMPQNNAYVPRAGQRTVTSLASRLSHVVDNQLTVLRHQDIEDAYTRFGSKLYRQRNTSEMFQQYLAEHPEYLKNRSVHFDRVAFKDEGALLHGTLTTLDYRTYPVKYHLVKEGEQWKIQDFQSLAEEEPLAADEHVLDTEEPPPSVENNMEFSKIVIGRQVDDKGLITEPTAWITPDTNLIFINVYIKNGVEHALVTLFLTHADSSSSAPPISTSLQSNGDSVALFSFAAPRAGWPEGEYVVKVVADNGQEAIQKFLIRKEKN